MEKSVVTVLIAAVVSLIAWNVKTTNDLQISVTRLETILNSIAMEN
jgi:hypothetical protein